MKDKAKRLFDAREIFLLISDFALLKVETDRPIKEINEKLTLIYDKIDSEIRRNVREFADKVKPTDREAHLESRVGYIIQQRIDEELSRLGIA